jgi:hypothetical protein
MTSKTIYTVVEQDYDGEIMLGAYEDKAHAEDHQALVAKAEKMMGIRQSHPMVEELEVSSEAPFIYYMADVGQASSLRSKYIYVGHTLPAPSVGFEKNWTTGVLQPYGSAAGRTREEARAKLEAALAQLT